MAKKRISPNLTKVGNGRSKNEPFVQLGLDLLESDAWRTQSINCRRLIEFLMIRHMRTGGRKNAELIATYEELVAYGIGRRLIHTTITEAERRGLICVERGGRKGFCHTSASRFAITFFIEKVESKFGQYYASPTSDWRRYRDPKRKKPDRAGEMENPA